MTIVVEWSDSRSLEILKKKTEEVLFSLEKDYVDDSKSIVGEIWGRCEMLRFPSLWATMNHKYWKRFTQRNLWKIQIQYAEKEKLLFSRCEECLDILIGSRIWD